MTKKKDDAQAPQAPDAENQSGHASVASTVGAKAADVSKLLAEIADLREQLGQSEEKRTAVEAAALAAAEAQGVLMQRQIEEVPTGKTKEVKRAKGYEVVSYTADGRDVLKPVWERIKVPTFFYKVDLPPVGGEGLTINQIPLLHGVVYELDLDTLRSVKEMVFRCWDHDRNIHGTDENFYRRQAKPALSARG